MQTVEPDIKRRILLAAKKLFAKQGFEATTVRQICEEAGANVALVSYHFGGKENVFNALFETFFPNDRVREVGAQKIDPVTGIALIIREVTLYRLKDPEMISLLHQEITRYSPRIGKIREHAFPIWVMLRDFLREGKQQGLFRFGSLNHAFMSVLGCILFHNNSYYFEPLFDAGSQDTEQLIAYITEFVLCGLHYKAE